MDTCLTDPIHSLFLLVDYLRELLMRREEVILRPYGAEQLYLAVLLQDLGLQL